MRPNQLYTVKFSVIVGLALCLICKNQIGLAETQKGLWFERNGERVFLLGANYPFYNAYRGADLGPYRGTKPIANVALTKDRGRDKARNSKQVPIPVAPGATSFDAEGIEAQLGDMHDIGIHVLRWFWGEDGRAFLELDKDGNCTGIDPAALQNIDRVVALAEKHQVFLVPCLLNNLFIGGNDHLLYEDGTLGAGHPDTIKDPQKRKSLLDNYIKPLAARYADKDGILYWEIMNEAANIVSGTDPKTGCTVHYGDRFPEENRVTPVELQTFLNEAYEAIKSVDKKHPIMPSGLARPFHLPLIVGRVKADLYGAHYDDDGTTDYGKVRSVDQIKKGLFQKYRLVLDKPLVMTEGTHSMNTHLDYYVTQAYEGGWAGYLPWTYYGLIGLSYFIHYDRTVTSKDGKPNARPNIEFYKQFNREHVNELLK